MMARRFFDLLRFVFLCLSVVLADLAVVYTCVELVVQKFEAYWLFIVLLITIPLLVVFHIGVIDAFKGFRRQ